jgi:hypothetical protein
LARPHTSELLEELVSKAPDGPVDLEWLLGHLDKRSFGLPMLLLGLLVIIPASRRSRRWPSCFPRSSDAGPERSIVSAIPVEATVRLQAFQAVHGSACPLLKAIEGVSRPRWNARHDVMDRFVGLVVFLLALSAGWPLPLVNVIPGMAVVLIAIAYL